MTCTTPDYTLWGFGIDLNTDVAPILPDHNPLYSKTSKIFFSGRCFEDYHFGHTKANFFFAQVYYNFYARSSFKKTNSLHIMLNLLSLSKLAGNLPCDQWILWERWSYLVNSLDLLFMTHKQNAAQRSIQYFHCSWPKICKSSNLIEAWLLNVNATCHLFLHLVLIANATTLRVTFWLWKLFQMRFSAKEQRQPKEKNTCYLKNKNPNSPTNIHKESHSLFIAI